MRVEVAILARRIGAAGLVWATLAGIGWAQAKVASFAIVLDACAQVVLEDSPAPVQAIGRHVEGDRASVYRIETELGPVVAEVNGHRYAGTQCFVEGYERYRDIDVTVSWSAAAPRAAAWHRDWLDRHPDAVDLSDRHRPGHAAIVCSDGMKIITEVSPPGPVSIQVHPGFPAIVPEDPIGDRPVQVSMSRAMPRNCNHHGSGEAR